LLTLGDKKSFTSEKRGNDETGDGSEGKPFKTVLQALKAAGQEPFPSIFVDAKEDGKVIQLMRDFIIYIYAMPLL
jgi:asparaginyl-tRNA synthetase